MPSIKNIVRLSFSAFILSVGLSGCTTKEDTAYVERSVEELYNEGRAHLAAGRYEKAAVSFDEIERQHPYSEWAAQSQLMSAYSYYLGQKYEKALIGVESFIVLHPSHMDVAYAYYLRGLCYYEQISTVQRDQRITDLALNAFWELVKKCPGTLYARDARIKIELLRNNLAARDMDVGRYYQRKKAHVAAINRFKDVVINYQTTSHVEEALHRLVEIYLVLGLNTEARKVATVLGHNFPGSYWYLYTYQLINEMPYDKLEFAEDSASWIDSLVFNHYDDKFDDNSDDNAFAQIPNRDINTNKTTDLARPIERFGTRDGFEKARKKINQESDTLDKLTDYLDLSTLDDSEQKPPASVSVEMSKVKRDNGNQEPSTVDSAEFDPNQVTGHQNVEVQKLDKLDEPKVKMVN